MGQVVDLGIFRESRQVVRLDLAARQQVSLRPVEKRKRTQCQQANKDFLFPAIEFGEWSDLIGLNPIQMRCECGDSLTCEVPFVTKSGEVAGLMATPCSCGSDRTTAIHTEFAAGLKKRYGFIFAKGDKKAQ